jgi:hypothetical protein
MHVVNYHPGHVPNMAHVQPMTVNEDVLVLHRNSYSLRLMRKCLSILSMIVPCFIHVGICIYIKFVTWLSTAARHPSIYAYPAR